MSRPRPAFTLIEMLLVISLITLLIALLMPSLGRSKEIARRAICLSNSRQMMIAASVFADNNKGKYPKMVSWGWEYEMVKGTDVEQYLQLAGNNGLLFYCPSFDYWGAGPTLYGQMWPDYNYTPYDGWVLHPVSYRLYIGAGLQARSRPLVIKNPSMSTSNIGGAAPSATIAITCHPPSLSAGQTYPGAHRMEGITSAFVDQHGEWIPSRELRYDAPWGTTSSLPAIRRPWVGMDATPHTSGMAMQ